MGETREAYGQKEERKVEVIGVINNWCISQNGCIFQRKKQQSIRPSDPIFLPDPKPFFTPCQKKKRRS